MKTTRTFTLFAAALFVGFIVARWTEAQPATAKPTAIEDIDVQELESLENYLYDTHQTNAVKQLNDILSDNRTWNRAVEMSITVRILRGLRNGKTDEVLNFLENHLDSDISFFALEYRALPIAFQKQMNMKSLQAAYDYRTKFPFKSSNEYAEDVTNAFKILNGNSAK